MVHSWCTKIFLTSKQAPSLSVSVLGGTFNQNCRIGLEFIFKWINIVDNTVSFSLETEMERLERLSGLVKETNGLSETCLKASIKSRSFPTAATVLIGHLKNPSDFWHQMVWSSPDWNDSVNPLKWELAACASLTHQLFHRRSSHLQDHLSAIVWSHKMRQCSLTSKREQ